MKAEERKIDVVIPIYRPGDEFLKLTEYLQKQTCPVNRVILMNTEKVFFDEKKYLRYPNEEVHHITREEFDHAATRHQGLLLSEADYVLFMTMDAIPADDHLVENLLASFSQKGPEGESVAVAYARQLPKSDCNLIERFTRSYNYPEADRIQTAADIHTLGFKAFFCSDTCAMYHRNTYLELGGFVEKAIFNEDMFFASKALDQGFGVAYASRAKVFHSHNYSLRELFRRNFDMGVSQAEHPEIFNRVKTTSTGMDIVKRTASWLLAQGKWYMLPWLVLVSGFKFLGYKAGLNYQRLSRSLVLKLTMNRYYWK